ncbi:phage shock envelope stress response protein PspM [Amycolatopsis sp. NPDC004368]
MAGSGGRRDFSEFNAKLEKHIEKLPDYAQRAQEKLQRYFPPADQAGGKPTARPTAPHRPAPPVVRRPTTFSQVAGQVPAVAEARAKWQRWNEPAAKHQRCITRTSRVLTLWLLITIFLGVLTVLAGTGLMGAGGTDVAQTVLAGFGTLVFGTFSVRTGLKLRQLKKLEIPGVAEGGAPPPLPPAASAAREPMERLAESEASLGELLRQLSVPTSTGTAAVPEVSVADARATAVEAARALRGLAARVQAIERGRNSAPERERGALDAAVAKLREQLDDGIEGFGSLVAAAGRAVAASSDGMGTSKQALTDATDHLAGLALALRDLA